MKLEKNVTTNIGIDLIFCLLNSDDIKTMKTMFIKYSNIRTM